MWVFTEHGYYSVVADRTKPTQFVWVRARSEADIRRVADSTGHDVMHLRTADYPWRIKMRHTEWAAFLSTTVNEINYPNYKNRVATHDADRASLYGEVWSLLARRLESGWFQPSPAAPVEDEYAYDWTMFSADVLEEFMEAYDYAGVDDEAGLTDLLTGLLRAGNDRGINISQVLRHAEMHFLEGTLGDNA